MQKLQQEMLENSLVLAHQMATEIKKNLESCDIPHSRLPSLKRALDAALDRLLEIHIEICALGMWNTTSTQTPRFDDGSTTGRPIDGISGKSPFQ